MLLSVQDRTGGRCLNPPLYNCSFKRGKVSHRDEEKVPRSIFVEGKRTLRKEELWSNPFQVSSTFKLAKDSHSCPPSGTTRSGIGCAPAKPVSSVVSHSPFDSASRPPPILRRSPLESIPALKPWGSQRRPTGRWSIRPRSICAMISHAN